MPRRSPRVNDLDQSPMVTAFSAAGRPKPLHRGLSAGVWSPKAAHRIARDKLPRSGLGRQTHTGERHPICAPLLVTSIATHGERNATGAGAGSDAAPCQDTHCSTGAIRGRALALQASTTEGGRSGTSRRRSSNRSMMSTWRAREAATSFIGVTCSSRPSISSCWSPRVASAAVTTLG